jgi:hypothetical protein
VDGVAEDTPNAALVNTGLFSDQGEDVLSGTLPPPPWPE